MKKMLCAQMRKTASVESVKLTPPTLEKELEFIENFVDHHAKNFKKKP